MPDITADILDQPNRPSLSSTSDMPVVAPENPQPEETPAAEPAADATVAEATADETPTEEAKPEEGKPKKNGINERFSTLTEQRKAAEAKASEERAARERVERMLEEALARIPKDPPASETNPTEPPKLPDRPKRENFDDPAGYDEALIEWSAQVAMAKQRAELDRERAEKETHDKAAQEAAERAKEAKTAEERFKATQAAFAERRNAFAEKHPDYAEIAERDELQISLPVGLAILADENGPAVAYYLGQHPEEAKRIADMVVPGQVFPQGHPSAGQPMPDAQRQLIEFGKILAQVTAPQTAKVLPPPPRPITPIRGGSNGAVNRSADEMSMDEYAAKAVADGRVRSGILTGRGVRVN